MNVDAARRSARAALKAVASADESDYLLAYVLARDRAWLYAHPEYRLDGAAQQHLQRLIARRKAGLPWAYLKGYQEFYGLDFAVNEEVLIPRPETEIAVAYAINSAPKDAAVLDLGSGCGAIAVAVAYHRADLRIVASDLSAEALRVARKNAARHRCKITFVCSDWYQNIAGRFDCIISNPPYVAYGDTDIDRAATAAEPRLALYAGADGSAGLRAVISGAAPHLKHSGTLLVEHGYQQAERVAGLMRAAGFWRIRCLKDNAGHRRYTLAQLNNG